LTNLKNKHLEELWAMSESLPDIPVSLNSSGWRHLKTEDGEAAWLPVYSDPDGDFEIAVAINEPGQFPPHNHGSDEYIIIASGECKIDVQGSETVELKRDGNPEGRVVVIPGPASHTASYSEKSKVIAVIIPRGEGL